TLEREVIGLEREDDVPGALIPALYFDFLRSRRAAPLARVFDHNRHDVLSLVALLGWFGRALAAHDHLGAEDRSEEHTSELQSRSLTTLFRSRRSSARSSGSSASTMCRAP